MTQKKEYDYSVVICRCNPPHLGHKDLIDFALSQSEKVIILLGSAHRPRTIKNPFKWHERMLMIESMYSVSVGKFIFKPLNDYMYNNQKWAMEVQNTIDLAIEEDNSDPDTAKVCLVGNIKDDSSWYLSIFPQFPLITSEFKKFVGKEILSATQIRKIMFESDTTETMKKLEPHVHKGVRLYIQEFMKTKEFGKLAMEHAYIRDYKKSWEAAPYPPTFVTTDILLIQSGHVLLIERRAEPGRGLFAMPGGFLNQNELIVDGAIRELHEETRLKVPIPVLKGNIKEVKVFDNINRSSRGRTITHVVHIELPDGTLPRVKGNDDASRAFWLPLKDIKADTFFEDHIDIIQSVVGV